MTEPPDARSGRRQKPILPLVGLALLLAAWGMFSLGRFRASQLDLSQFGTCDDVYDAVVRAAYVARHQLPYFTAAAMLDGLALVVLFAAVACGPFRVLAVLVGVLWVPSAGLHWLGWFVTFFFAQ